MNVAPSLQLKLAFAQRLLRKARSWLPADMGVTIVVHKAKLIDKGGGFETAVVTTLASRKLQRVALTEALWQSGLADGADDPVQRAIDDLAELEPPTGAQS
jgi:hypothetical protein